MNREGDNNVNDTPLCQGQISCQDSGKGEPTICYLYSSPGNVSINSFTSIQMMYVIAQGFFNAVSVIQTL